MLFLNTKMLIAVSNKSSSLSLWLSITQSNNVDISSLSTSEAQNIFLHSSPLSAVLGTLYTPFFFDVILKKEFLNWFKLIMSHGFNSLLSHFCPWIYADISFLRIFWGLILKCIKLLVQYYLHFITNPSKCKAFS